ncbi:putative rhomboid protease [Microsporum audouinii]
MVFWVLSLQTVWDVPRWGALVPSDIGPAGMYRINTYPIVHAGCIHAFINVLGVTPLLERFEAEHGTLTSLAMFVGSLSTLPAGIYVLLAKFVLRTNTGVLGSSSWFYVLLSSEAIKRFQTHPHISLGKYQIPTWTFPLILNAVASILLPNKAFIGHTCCIAVGYILGLGYLKFLFPPEKVLRWLETKLNLLGRLPHYVSVDQKTYGRYGILPTNGVGDRSIKLNYVGSSQRLGP